MSHVSQKDIIREQDEFNDGLISEVAELRKIIQNKAIDLKTKHFKTFQTSKIEKQLMRLAEIDRRQLAELRELKKGPQASFQAKFEVFNSANENLDRRCRELKSELSRKALEINSAELEKYRIESDFIYLKQENEMLKQQVESLNSQISFLSNKEVVITGKKKLLKSNSSKIVSNSTIPTSRCNKKGSLILSPLSIASFPTVSLTTTKREKQSEGSKVNKSNFKLEKPVKIKRSIY